jgi:hypothetical protein
MPDAFAFTHEGIFTAIKGQVYRWLDSGNTWALSSTGLPPDGSSEDINFLIAHHDDLYAGFYSGKLFKSADNGLSWTVINTGFPSSTNLFAMAVSETNLFVGGRLFEGQFGVYSSTDNGGSWASANKGLPMFQNRALVIHDNILFGSFSGDKSVWSAPVEDIITGIGSYPAIAQYSSCGGAGINAYPNPTHASIRIDFDEHRDGVKQIMIIDFSGKPVKQKSPMDTGGTLNVSEYPPGVYVIKVVYGAKTCYTKFVKQ